MSKTAFIIGLTADIGRELAVRFARDGWQIAGTLRPGARLGPESAKWDSITCDLASDESIDGAIRTCRERRLSWDILVVAAGTEDPIGNFFECDADQWQRGIAVNTLGPLRFLRGLHSLRNASGQPSVAFFSGSGTNNAAPAYSAYCAAKIMLIKMCELLDAESSDTNFFIVGPGIVRTKIHEQTLKEPVRSGVNYKKVVEFLGSSNPGTSHDTIYDCLRWCHQAGKAAMGGRNISLVHDEWQNGGVPLAAALKTNQDLYKLRRSGNDRRFNSAPSS